MADQVEQRPLVPLSGPVADHAAAQLMAIARAGDLHAFP
jgi:hypothetical protein